jgi:hypothetical protein
MTTPKSPDSTTIVATSTQYIAASVDDDRLEPDALRGSEHLLQNVKGLDNLEQKRIDIQTARSKRPA